MPDYLWLVSNDGHSAVGKAAFSIPNCSGSVFVEPLPAERAASVVAMGESVGIGGLEGPACVVNDFLIADYHGVAFF